MASAIGRLGINSGPAKVGAAGEGKGGVLIREEEENVAG